MKRHGYKGAGDISKRIGRVYGWEATTVDDWIFYSEDFCSGCEYEEVLLGEQSMCAGRGREEISGGL